MPKGGKRRGAGRPRIGSTLINEEARATALKDGLTPLDYMLAVLRDLDEKPDRRMDAAKAAAPYLHARLNAVEHKGEGGGPMKVEFVTNYLPKP